MDTNDKEIMNASRVIDRALSKMNEENRGEEALNMLNVVRNLNDHIALKVWRQIEPNQPMDINKVAKKLINRNPYQFIGRFDKYLRKSLSHFTPNEDGAERLSIKYYPYLFNLKKLMRDNYGVEILENIHCFVPNTDNQTQDYYDKIAEVLRRTSSIDSDDDYDNYYIHRVIPFFSKGRIFYEVTLEPADEKTNKFNRITAFCRGEFTSNYCTALSFAEKTIEVFGVNFPIKIIVGWRTSIRPCEINNFAKLLNYSIKVSREHNEYIYLMDYLSKNGLTLLDIIDLDDDDYLKIKNYIINTTREKRSLIFKILDDCRKISIENLQGKNILRYLLCRMNNRIIKMQCRNSSFESIYCFNIPRGCQPFDEKPISFNPKGHRAVFDDVLESIQEFDIPSFIAKIIEINTSQGYRLYTPLTELEQFGDKSNLIKLANDYNGSLYYKFRPDSEIRFYKDYAYLYGDESHLLQILQRLRALASDAAPISKNFSLEFVEELKKLSAPNVCLDDSEKEKILLNMFDNSRIRLIYGAAGTGKTTLINFVAKLTSGERKLFLAKTNPAVENLRRRVTFKEQYDVFTTIDKFTKNRNYIANDFDIIVVDECSTVTNEEMIYILDKLGEGALLLVGDIYQIQAIGFGNWFYIAKTAMPSECCCELGVPFRSPDEGLKNLWKEVRNISDDNTILEELVRNEYSHIIDDTIFDRKSDDEIILCLNYNGLYGLNNINKLLQVGNKNKAVTINIWQFKVDDPILFNDSERFAILYNNLKGRIVGIEDRTEYVIFQVKVFTSFSEEEVEACYGLTFVEGNDEETVISFRVNRRPPYSSDAEAETDEHIIPFEVAYAVSIHKSQGLEYDSVKIVIADDTEDKITHSIFYTAITRAKSFLTIYWSPEVCNRVLKSLTLPNYNKDYLILKEKFGL